ncbi:ATP-binding protein [Aeromonas hydrophila]|uniref:ATP-binding protein n=1 Tax=Aeromonas hydrophila TaxID=644 RepID=UPI002B470875|nr:transporter substrate-binding domain-containing protein [Aeromonas hydrophila]
MSICCSIKSLLSQFTIIVGFSLFFAPVLLASELPEVSTIEVGILAGGWAPFQRWDGKVASGFSVELMEQLAKKLDYRIAWHAYPDGDAMYADICSGKIDILLDAFNAEGRPCVTYSLPYYTSPTVVVVRQDSALFRDVSRLQSASIAIEKGFMTEKLVKLHYPKVTPRLFLDTRSALQAVEQGRADAYIGNLYVANLFIKRHPALAVVAQSPLLMETLHLGVASQNKTLSTRLNTAIQALTVETRSELEKRWLGENLVPNFMGHSNFLLRPDERAWLSALPPLKLGLSPGWMPFYYRDRDDNLVGMAVDYLALLQEKLGLAYSRVPVQSWPDLQQQLLHHDVDLVVLPTRIIDRLIGWHASQPFASFPMVLVTASGTPTIGDITDLTGKRLLLTDGMLIPQIKALLPDVTIKVTSNASEGLAAVAAGKGDAYIGNLVVVSRLIAEQFEDQLNIAAPSPFKDELVVAVREPYTPLLPLVNRVLASMSDKERRQIRNTWLALNYSEGVPWQQLMRTLIPLGSGITLFILVICIAYWRLRQEITRRRQVELALARAKERAESAAAMKGEFLATMSHEIRTPMNGIIGMAEQLTFTDLTQDQRQMVEVINRGAQGLHALLDNVLDFAKLEAGKMQLEQAPFLVRDLLDSVLTMTVSEVHRKGLRVYLWADAGVAARVSGDVLRLRQILFNFVSNAIKFTERGFIEISVQLLAQREGQQQLRFGVRDSGIGMTPEARDRIFNAFEQAESSTTRSYGGTGLGLSICQTLATLMGGEIRLESAPGLGTFITLEVRLPVLAQREPDLRLNGVQACIELHDEKLCHTLLLHLDALGVTRTSKSGDAQLRFTDHEFAAKGIIRVLPLSTPLGYRCDEGGYILNSNPMTWHAVREVCYRQFGLSDRAATKAIRKSAPMLPCRVLLVEDNSLNQSLVIRQLRQLELSCDLAEHGQQALEMVAQHPYDLVLCDCQMPVMDGYEFTRRIRAAEKGERLLIIAMTANVLPEQAERCFAAGMDDLLGKPVLLDALRQMLQKWQIMPSPTLIDIAAMEAFFGHGDKLRQMFPFFRQDLEQSMAQVPLDDNALANWVHRQAGTISMMMAPELAEQAWRLEEKIRQFGSPACADELTCFRAQLQQIVDELTLLSEKGHSVIEGELE